MVDGISGRVVGLPGYWYGCHVVVLGIVCSPQWTKTARGIERSGPGEYGYGLEHKLLGEYIIEPEERDR